MAPPVERVRVIYKIRSAPDAIEDRALGLAIEQSVEMPLTGIRDRAIRSGVVGTVASIKDCGEGWFEVQNDLAAATFGNDPGQMLNMLFGNASLYDDVVLLDFSAPDSHLAGFSGPRHGIDGVKQRFNLPDRALTCSALKPLGLPSAEFAKLAFRLALGGLDIIKDDHGLANQSYSPFAERIAACAAAVREAKAVTGRPTRYAPCLSGSYPEMEKQLLIARDEGLDVVLIAPMIAGVSNFQALARANPDFIFLAHPAMTGGARVSPVAVAKLVRLFGADAWIFPNYGGRFSYSAEICRDITNALRCPWGGLGATLPTPAGGMTLDRIPEILGAYGRDSMLLIGGAILSAPVEDITNVASAFTQAVVGFDYRNRA
jgi:ribulose-bisphosphate carboxylase large chain